MADQAQLDAVAEAARAAAAMAMAASGGGVAGVAGVAPIQGWEDVSADGSDYDDDDDEDHDTRKSGGRPMKRGRGRPRGSRNKAKTFEEIMPHLICERFGGDAPRKRVSWARADFLSAADDATGALQSVANAALSSLFPRASQRVTRLLPVGCAMKSLQPVKRTAVTLHRSFQPHSRPPLRLLHLPLRVAHHAAAADCCL